LLAKTRLLVASKPVATSPAVDSEFDAAPVLAAVLLQQPHDVISSYLSISVALILAVCA
jgi:hypothetical protein